VERAADLAARNPENFDRWLTHLAHAGTGLAEFDQAAAAFAHRFAPFEPLDAVNFVAAHIATALGGSDLLPDDDAESATGADPAKKNGLTPSG
jgi:hypothetical protein